MKISEAKKKILINLDDIVNEYNYKINKSKFCLIKEEDNFFSSLYFTYNTWPDEMHIISSVEFGIQRIDDILDKFGKSYQRSCWINLKRLYYWYENKEWKEYEHDYEDRYILSNLENDLEKAILNVKELFINYGIRYFKEYGTVEGVDRLYNSNLEEEESIHCNGFQVKSVIGLIAAKLSGNPNYAKISESYTKMINKHKEEDTMLEEDIEVFFKVKEYLENIS